MISFCFESARQMLPRACALLIFALLAAPASLLAQQKSVVDSVHNLSISGPGGIRALTEDQVCIFCHTPHHASNVKPLWNRAMPVGPYTPYRSNSLQALPDQPTGSSKLCLSCHDGTIALGSVVSRTQQITMASGITRMPAGTKNLGTDLSDDHPISFPYDQTLVGKNPKLKSPTGLPSAIRLDSNNELQCTSCHDPHDDQFGKFLVMSNTASQLCNSCHNQGTTTVTSHTTCSSCHQPHSAPSGPYLLRGQTVTTTCTSSTCHGTSAPETRLNIASDIGKFSNHDTNSAVNLPNHVPNNAVCSDCHEGHTMGNTSASGAPAISPRLGKISGVNALGSKVAAAQYEYEVCYKCHADTPTTLVTVKARQITERNKRLQFSPSNAISFHPVGAVGRSTDVPSLLAPWTTSSIMYCTDCHASNSSPAGGGTGARGPHGSLNTSVLVKAYTTTDGTTESPAAYALCYSCHDRASILGNVTFADHNRHIVKAKAPCSVCHDSHGISQQGTQLRNQRLINFDTAVVLPDRNGRLEYQRTGTRTGLCYLKCHNRSHTPSNYP